MIVDVKFFLIDAFVQKNNLTSSISPPQATIHQVLPCVFYFFGRYFVQLKERLHLFENQSIILHISVCDGFVRENDLATCPNRKFGKQRHH